MAPHRTPRPDPAPTFACFRPDRRSGRSAAPGHGLWLIDTPATLATVMAGNPTAPLRADQRQRARQALQAAPPLACRGLQRIDWSDEAGRLGSLSFAIGLSPGDRRRLLRAWGHAAAAEDAAPKAAAQGPLLVVGAGLAGAHAAAALTRRGHRVVVIDREPAPGGAVADVPLLAQHPALSADDNARSRLSRAALLLAWRLRGLAGPALQWCGRRQRVDGDPARYLGGWPPELARQLAPLPARGPARDGTDPVAGAGVIRFDRCALARTDALLERLLDRPGISLRLGHPASRLDSDGDGWWVHDEAGGPGLGPFGAVIVACPDHEHLTGLVPPWLAAGHRTIGQVAIATGCDTGTAGSGQAGDGSGAPTAAAADGGEDADTDAGVDARIEGGHRAGRASFRLEWGACRVVGVQPPPDKGDEGGKGDEADVAEVAGAVVGSGDRGWRLSRPAMRLDPVDHLPLIGPVPDLTAIRRDAAAFARNDRLAYPLRPGLFLATGLGGRGLLWSQLAGEWLAGWIDDEPPLIEASLAAAIDPARFIRRRLRRGLIDADG